MIAAQPKGNFMPVTKSQNAIFGLIAFIVFLDMAGVGLIIPVLPTLVAQLSHQSIDQAASIGGIILFAYALMQFIFSPIIGGLSDRYGRRPVLLITLAAMGIDYALMAWAPTLTWLFVGRLVSGAMGATWAAANSCIADTFLPEERGAKFGLLGGAGAFGFVLGPAIGGALGDYGLRLPFIAAAVLALSGAIIGFFIFHETLPPEKRRAFSFARANPFGTLGQMAKTPLVIGLLAVIFLMQLAGQSQMATWAYFLIAKFNWSTLQIGLSVTLFGALLAVAQGLLTGKAISRFGAKHAALISMFFGIPSYLLLAFAPGGWAIYVAIIIGGMSGITFPAIQSMMSDKVGENSQGELQGAVASIMSLTAIIGPVVMTRIFSHFADGKGTYFPGAPFLLATGLLALSIGLYIFVIKRAGAAPSPQSQSSSRA
jgi:MFS transporter, DHA1 family, tetracycline resistance protein